MCDCITRSEIINLIIFAINHLKSHNQIDVFMLEHFDADPRVFDCIRSFIVQQNPYILRANGEIKFVKDHLPRLQHLLQFCKTSLSLDAVYSQAVNKYGTSNN
ncbi:late expression factor 11 [Neodiprion abietis nucleopolyhedrovirus]|uniref:Late expression factor 11 n=1 Tax=Neodiprion abietis nucleopolyhedrovirus TaxID=204507 RepID=Q0ZP73_9CBAC|nr:late expression factor 11 [Neodiprion abietis nucleopolyhedrovirus]ABC74881.1 late expression factor 11 [Neodiprion abietis nucleopolyhedrovirus]